ncbi:MAG: hypothetical protein HS127_13515 [Planctomycetia bacterium]|nr:hypothetical protein [Planctomycetia bacterium]
MTDKNVTLVFDRGIISEDNANLIEEAKLKYIRHWIEIRYPLAVSV